MQTRPITNPCIYCAKGVSKSRAARCIKEGWPISHPRCLTTLNRVTVDVTPEQRAQAEAMLSQEPPALSTEYTYTTACDWCRNRHPHTLEQHNNALMRLLRPGR